mmetsp:Transcript_42458/g.137295  ORF Transcript_42458/g.137295 Transcript_42458/m.137295 type:complete len:218 (+) Transcript_42458:513-1166(+)
MRKDSVPQTAPRCLPMHVQKVLLDEGQDVFVLSCLDPLLQPLHYGGKLVLAGFDDQEASRDFRLRGATEQRPRGGDGGRRGHPEELVDVLEHEHVRVHQHDLLQAETAQLEHPQLREHELVAAPPPPRGLPRRPNGLDWQNLAAAPPESFQVSFPNELANDHTIPRESAARPAQTRRPRQDVVHVRVAPERGHVAEVLVAPRLPQPRLAHRLPKPAA